jgi:hypothetical protein
VEGGKVFGMPLWLALVALGGAGAVGYLLFFRKGSSSSSASTGTTGYSSQGLAVMQNPDESATMALQNQELSILAQQLGAQGQQIASGFGDQAALSQAGFANLSGQLTSDTTGLQQQMLGLAQQGTDTQNLLTAYYQWLQQGQTNLGGQLSNLQNSQNASSSANSAYYNSLLSNLINYSNSLSTQVQGVGSQVSNFQQGQSVWDNTLAQKIDYNTAVSNTWFPTLQGDIQYLFYQIPNRYKAIWGT